MKLKDIELKDISKFRAEHMGLAMIFIVLFHVGLPRSDAFFGLRRMGNIGVDIFMFLSGIGLWFSWMKEQNSPTGFVRRWAAFYWRRLKRVYPVWILIAALYYVPRFLKHETHTMEQWTDLFGDILINWGFWQHDELTFWYVPAIMMLYVFAPPYMEMIRRWPVYRWMVVLPLMWCVIMQYVTPVHQAVGHIEIFWSRVPIFFLGINIADSVRTRQSIPGNAIWMILLLFAVSLSACIWLEQMRHGRFPLFLERMLYIPLTITSLLLLTRMLEYTPRWFNAAMVWVGGISLEIYLIHSEFVLKPLSQYHLGYWPTFLATVAISFPVAYLLQKTLKMTGLANK